MTDSKVPDCFSQLRAHWETLQSTVIIDLFEQDQDRFENLTVRLGDLLFDVSKQHVDQTALKLLDQLAGAAGLSEKREALFRGDKVNRSENRAALHTALRRSRDETILVDGVNVVEQVHEELDRALWFAEAVRSGDYEITGGRVTDVVNIGIGGSDLGPRMATRALAPYCDGPQIHFVSNVDGADLSDTLAPLDLATTLFIVSSKSFTTQETMMNARSAHQHVSDVVGGSVNDHFCAVSTNLDATRAFGIEDERTFQFWDWVGGRYSVWSVIGLPLMMAIGPDAFQAFLGGARRADQHFLSQPCLQNIPVLLGLIGIWNRNICNREALAILPYDNRMADFPRWLQQLDMESNGKHVTVNGTRVVGQTSPIIFGEPGTNGQHAFFQLLHQGTGIVPCDFLVAAKGHEDRLEAHHTVLVSNCFAQSDALMRGCSLAEAGGDPRRAFDGNRPSSTFIYNELDPETLGMLMAFYEHKVFVQSAVWGTNPFDQWGVELGKTLAKAVAPALESGDPSPELSASTNGLIRFVQEMKRK